MLKFNLRDRTSISVPGICPNMVFQPTANYWKMTITILKFNPEF